MKVLDNTGEVVAAISVSGPSSRMPAKLAGSELQQDVAKAAAAISEALGYRLEK